MQRPVWQQSSRIIEAKVQKRRAAVHDKAMKGIRCTIDNKGPKLKRVKNLKKLQMEEGA